MSEEKKSIENLQGQETNTDEVKGGFSKKLDMFPKKRKSDQDHELNAKRHKGNTPDEQGEINSKSGYTRPGNIDYQQK